MEESTEHNSAPAVHAELTHRRGKLTFHMPKAHTEFLNNIDIKDAEAIRRVVRAAFALPLPDIEKTIKFSGRWLGTTKGSLNSNEARAAKNIQELWLHSEQTRCHIVRLIKDCDQTYPDYLLVKATQSAIQLIKGSRYRSVFESAEACSPLTPLKVALPGGSSAPRMTKNLKDHNGKGSTESPTPLIDSRTRGGRQSQLRYENTHTTNDYVNNSREEQIVEETCLYTHESSIFSYSDALQVFSGNDGNSYVPNRMLKELADHNAPGSTRPKRVERY